MATNRRFGLSYLAVLIADAPIAPHTGGWARSGTQCDDPIDEQEHQAPAHAGDDYQDFELAFPWRASQPAVGILELAGGEAAGHFSDLPSSQMITPAKDAIASTTRRSIKGNGSDMPGGLVGPRNSTILSLSGLNWKRARTYCPSVT